MRLSYYGWCCAKDCDEEAASRAAISIGDLTDLLVPLCADHLLRIKADAEALRGHDLRALFTEKE